MIRPYIYNYFIFRRNNMYNFTKIEKKWQKYWEENNTYSVENNAEGKENGAAELLVHHLLLVRQGVPLHGRRLSAV